MSSGGENVSEEPDERLEPCEISQETILSLDDDDYRSENVCIVTGAASGIGRAIAIATAGNGLTTVATDVDEEGLEETVDMADDVEMDGEVVSVPGDLTKDEDIENIVEEAADCGTIKYLANIAGTQHIDAIEDFPMDVYDTMDKVMLRAPVYLSKLAIPHMKESENGTGAIGNMSSVHGHYVTSDKVAYNITKFGLRALTQSIAAEGEGKIRSFSVSVGYVKTPLVTNQIPDTAEQRGISVDEVIEEVMLKQARTKTMMDPIEVANLFVLGFSNKHAKYLNGGDLLFDGGYALTYE